MFYFFKHPAFKACLSVLFFVSSHLLAKDFMGRDYMFPAKKIKNKKAYVILGFELDTETDLIGKVSEGSKRKPLLRPVFSSCSLDLTKIKHAANKTTSKTKKELKACKLFPGTARNAGEFNFSQSWAITPKKNYYVYEISPVEQLTLEGLMLYVELAKSKHLKLKTNDLMAVSNNDKKQARKNLKKIKNDLYGLRQSFISPYVLQSKQKLDAGKVYYLTDIKLTLADTSYAQLSDKKPYENYIEYFKPQKVQTEDSFAQAEQWFKERFKYQGGIEKLSLKKHKNLLKSYTKKTITLMNASMRPGVPGSMPNGAAPPSTMVTNTDQKSSVDYFDIPDAK